MKNRAIKINELYNLDQEEIEKASCFAKKVSTEQTLRHYAENRNQSISEYIIVQHLYGKCLEIAVSKWLKKRSFFKKMIKDVDFEIYDNLAKDFSSDLIIEKANGTLASISVKLSMFMIGGKTELLDGTCIEKSLPRQYSYTFQLSDLNKYGASGRDNGNHTAYICGDKINDKTVRISYLIDAKCVPRMLVLPFKDNLKQTKGCLMAKTCSWGKEIPAKLDIAKLRSKGIFEKMGDVPLGIEELIERQNNGIETQNSF